MVRPLSALALACQALEGPGSAQERLCHAARFLAHMDPQALPPERRRFVAQLIRATEPALVEVRPLDEATARFFADEIRTLFVELVSFAPLSKGSTPTLH